MALTYFKSIPDEICTEERLLHENTRTKHKERQESSTNFGGQKLRTAARIKQEGPEAQRLGRVERQQNESQEESSAKLESQ